MGIFKTNTKRKMIFLLGLGLLLSTMFLNIFPLINDEILFEKGANQEQRELHVAYFNNSMTPIYIDGDATGVGAHNWTWASNQPWCEGSGTWNDPYVIKNIMIDGRGTDNCIEIRNSNVPFFIRNTTLYNASSVDYYAAIYLENVNNSMIIENNCSNNGHVGIIFYDSCYNNSIQENILHNNDGAGISLRYSPNNTITYNWIANSTGAFGVYLLQSHYATFSNNTVQGSSAGIRIHATEHTKVNNNTFELNQVGISMRHGHYSIITQNIISSSWNHGIRLENTASCEIHDNLIYNTTYDGIRLIDNGRYNEISSNEIRNSSRYGVNVDDTNVHNNTFYLNEFIDNYENAVDDGTDNYWDNGSIGNYWDEYEGYDEDGDGIGEIPYDIAGSSGSQDDYPIWSILAPIYINGTATGVEAHNWTWASNQLWCTGIGTEEEPYIIANEKINGLGSSPIFIENSNAHFIIENCTLYNSTIQLNYGGIYLKNCENGEIHNNRIFNTFAGIHLITSNNIKASGNDCSSNGRYSIRIESSSNNFFSENDCSLNDFVGIHLKNSNNDNFISENNCSLNGLYGIELESSNNNTFLQNDCSSNYERGISLVSSKNNTFMGNNCSCNINYGIRLQASSNNKFLENDCSSNNWVGIHLKNSNDENIFSGNTIFSNGLYGIESDSSSNNSFYDNFIFNSTKHGIRLIQNSGYNKIYSNEIKNSSEYGIIIRNTNCQNNIFYKNYLIDNGENAVDNGTINHWDNGIIGNYWDDYTGSDTNLDGVGDDPYNIDGTGGGIDHYPIWFFYVLNPIFIDGDATGVGAHNWTWAAYQPWCEGKGTWSDPYVIKDLIIDGQGVDNCIEIRNSNVPFIIRNSTLYGASSQNYKAAIHLDHVNNSLILENNCSYNGHIGIIFYENCNNNTIQGNVIYNNQGAAISIRESSENNYIYNNWIAHCKGQFAIYLLQSNHNVLYKNFVFGCLTGIRIHATEHTSVLGNLCERNEVGISLRHGHYSRIAHNDIIHSSSHAIRLDTTAHCEIYDNYIYNTTYDGIRLIDNSRYNEIYSNEIRNSSRYGVNVDDTNVHNNTFFQNYFIDNDINALDDGTDNYWDNGSIGNYWDDYWDRYLGVDLNDDRIGDTPYNISGASGSQDNYPIWDDGPGENHPPYWDKLPSDQIVEFGSSFSYKVLAYDHISGIDHYWINDTNNFDINENGDITNSSPLSIGTYRLEVRAYDPYDNYCSALFSVKTQDTVSPMWDTTPINQEIDYNTSFSYDVDASDLSGIDHYWINDTTNFQIDIDGIITNVGTLDSRIYYLEIRAYDPSNNYCLATIIIEVLSEDEQEGEGDGPGIPSYGLVSVLLYSLASISLISIVIRKKFKIS